MCIGYRGIINPIVRHHYPEVRMEVTTTPPKPDWLGPFPEPRTNVNFRTSIPIKELAALQKLVLAAKAVIDGPPAGPDVIEKHKINCKRYEVALNNWKSIINQGE